MARRKKKPLADELAELTFNFCGLIIKGVFVCAVYVLKVCGQVLVEVLRLALNGMRWVIAENKRESVLLDARRREIWEERLDRWWGRSAPADEEPEEEEEEPDEPPDAELPEEEPPALPPLVFNYIGDGEFDKVAADDEEDNEGEEEADDDPGEDECFCNLPGGSVAKAIAIEERRLLALYRRKEKAEAVHSGNEKEWERYQNTVAWRSLLWDIEDTETRLVYLKRAVG